MTDSSDVRRRYAGVKIGGSRSRRAPHKPLLLAWAIARCLRGLDRLAPFDLVEREFSALFAAFGPHRKGGPGAHFPFWRLQNDEGIWEIDKPCAVRVYKNGQASPADLRALGVRAGLSAGDYAHFRANPADAWRAASRLIGDHFPESMRDAVLSAAGFDAVDPPDADVSVAVRPPDLRFRRRMLEIYGARCAVCGFGLTVGGHPTAPIAPIAIDAALIQWRSHGGPSDPRNGVCLCAVHRAAFDAGGFTIAPREGDRRLVAIVSDAAAGASLAAFRRHNGKPLAIPAALPPDLRPDESRIRWHNREVFKTPNDLPTPR